MSAPQKYLIEPLDPSKHRREGFDCGVDALNDYLKKRARKETDAGLAVCFVAVPESDPGCIAGFYPKKENGRVRGAPLSKAFDGGSG